MNIAITEIQAIAHSYWRSIKRGNRTFDSLSNVPIRNYRYSIKEQVLYLASLDVKNTIISEEDFSIITGYSYTDYVS